MDAFMQLWFTPLIILIGLMLLFMAGLPVAFSFTVVNMVGVYFLWGGPDGLGQLITSTFHSVSTFSFMPIPMFVLMGEVLFQTGVAMQIIDTLDKWMGRLPGRLGLIAVGSGTMLSVLSGSSTATTALLGTSLVPEMERRGYKKCMSLGPILGSGGLAMMIPPSMVAVFIAALGQISVADTLIGGIVPGLMMAVLYSTYIVVRCVLQPSVAPSYEYIPTPLSEKIMATIKYVLPAGIIVFLVTGVILVGLATPTEAAATGALGSFLLVAAYGRLNWHVVKKCFMGTVRISALILMINTGAAAFSQILAYSGMSDTVQSVVVSFQLTPVMVLAGIAIVGLIMGMFMSALAYLMILIPIAMPLIVAMDINPVLFAVILLLNVEMATTSPPYGGSLFVMKGVAPPDTKIGDIYRGALPFLGCDAIVMILMIVFPQTVLWLPSLMRNAAQ